MANEDDLVRCIGTLWHADDVYWKSNENSGQLLGRSPQGNAKAKTVNFAEQSGVYILYADFIPIYVGQANGRLYGRLKNHFYDGLYNRWNRFSWYGVRAVNPSGSLKANRTTFRVPHEILLNQIEAILIHGFRPPQNGQGGKFRKGIVRYDQVRDNRLGPSDRELAEMIARGEIKPARNLPNGVRIMKHNWRGWK